MRLVIESHNTVRFRQTDRFWLSSGRETFKFRLGQTGTNKEHVEVRTVRQVSAQLMQRDRFKLRQTDRFRLGLRFRLRLRNRFRLSSDRVTGSGTGQAENRDLSRICGMDVATPAFLWEFLGKI